MVYPDEIVIRNRRSRRWFTPFWRWVWFVCGLTTVIGVTSWLPHAWRSQACVVVSIVGALSFVGIIGVLYHGPVECLHLGHQLTALPLRTYDPEDIHAVHFAADPAEDYADEETGAEGPVRLTEVTIEPADGLKLRLIVDIGDAARIRAWAARIGVRVMDPEGYSVPGPDPADGV